MEIMDQLGAGAGGSGGGGDGGSQIVQASSATANTGGGGGGNWVSRQQVLVDRRIRYSNNKVQISIIMTSKIKVDNINKVSDDSNIIKKCGTTITLGASGDTYCFSIRCITDRFW